MNNQIKILVVDDDPDLLDLNRRILEGQGYDVITATDGESCIQSVNTNSPDLILMDVILPDNTGVEICRKIKSDPANAMIHILLISGLKKGPEDISTGLETGADGYIHRPIDRREFLARIEASVRIICQNKKIREQESVFRDLFEYSTIGKSMTRTDGIMHVNKAFADMLGYSVDELVDKNWINITHPDDIAGNREKIAILLSGIAQQARWEKRYIHKNGSIVWTDVSTFLHRNHDGEPLFFITDIIDITQRKAVEEKLKDSEEKFMLAFKLSSQAILVTRLSDGLIQDANAAFTTITGYRFDEAIGRTTLNLNLWLSEDDREKVINLIVLNEKLTDLQMNFRGKNGQIIHAIFSAEHIKIGNQDYILSNINDITQHILIEQALTESLNTFRKLYEESADPIMLMRDDRFFHCNQATIDMIGAGSREEIIGLTPGDISPPYQSDGRPSSESASQFISDAFSRGKQKFDWTCKKFNGEPLFLEVTLIPITFHGEEIIHVSWHDITQRKNQENQLRKSEEHLKLINDSSQDIIVSYDTEGRFTSVNRVFCEALQINPEFARGKTHLELGFPESQCREWELLHEKVLKTDTSLTAYSSTPLPEGEKRDFEVFLNPMHNTSGEIIGIGVVSRDITEQNLANQKIRERERQLSTLISNLPGVTYRCSIDPGYATEFVSQEMEVLTGYPLKMFVDNEIRFGELIHPEDSEMVWGTIQEKIAVRAPFEITYRIRTKQGDEKWIWEKGQGIPDETGELVALEGFLTDITEKRQTEEALKESEARFKLLIENSPDAIALVSPEGRFLYISPSGIKMFGYEATDIGQLSPDELTHPEDLPMVLGYLTDIITDPGRIITCNYRFRHKSGRWRWIESTFTNLLANKAIEAIVINFKDIHERKIAEDELRQREEDFRMLFEGDLSGNYISTPEGKLIRCNSSFVKILGYDSEEELLHTEMVKLYPGPSYREAFLKKLSDNKVLENNELDMVKKDGTIIHCIENVTGIFDQHGTLVRFQGYMFDITDRRRAEKMQQVQYEIAKTSISTGNLENLLEVTRTQLSSLIDTTNFFVALYDRESKMMRKAIWIDEKDSYEEWRADESVSGIVVKSRSTLLLDREGVEKMVKEHNVTLKGTPAACWLGVPLISDNEAIGAMVVQSYTDPKAYDRQSAHLMEIIAQELVMYIERDKAEKDLLAAKERAEQSDLLKSAFLANMSHEIRTPMNAIVGFAGMLNEPDLSAEDRMKYSGIISSRSDDLLHLINDILDISRIESGNATAEHTKVNILSILKEVETVIRQKIRKAGKERIQLVMSAPDCVTETFISDPYIIRQVLFNLIDNAIKFTDEGFIRFGFLPPEEEKITFFVKDTGIGIAPENLDLIFKTFRQADIADHHKRGGTGLGLAICKGSVELLGGGIRVESEPGRGSTFSFTIPFVQETKPKNRVKSQSPAPEVRKPGKTAMADLFNGRRVLLVEDEPANLEFLRILLARTGAEILVATSASELRRHLPTLKTIDLILLDVRLPDGNGWDLVKEIKQFRQDIPVIAQTAFAMTGDKEKSLAAGCDNYLSKPISPGPLLEMMQRYLPPANESPVDKA